LRSRELPIIAIRLEAPDPPLRHSFEGRLVVLERLVLAEVAGGTVVFRSVALDVATNNAIVSLRE